MKYVMSHTCLQRINNIYIDWPNRTVKHLFLMYIPINNKNITLVIREYPQYIINMNKWIDY